RGTFEIFLGLTREDSATLINNRKHLREGMLRSGLLPTSIVALPAPLSDVQAAGRDNPPHIVGIEVNDGSPRGLWQTDRDRRTIINRADSLGIALVSGGNNHGWGHVVPAWTLLRIPGWRSLAPDSLAASIESSLRTAPRLVQVVERRRPTLSSPLSVIATLPVAAAIMLATLTMTERGVWLFWIWILWAAWRGVRSVRAS
ncbi:MAG TPA: hypothetical protein VKO87_04540, partial [Gemmatimonadaceae bacterium]|nr:hypothetical protein [Gemmatimonadaceae bacterium]